MGFGWLLTGYFFTFVVSLYSPLSFAMLAGYPMMIMALWSLAPYHRHFRTVFYLSFLSLPFALYYAIYGLGKMGVSFPAKLFEGALWQSVEWTYFAFSLLFTLMLLWAIMALCGELGLVKLQGNAMRNAMLICLMYVFDMISRLPVSFIQAYQGYIVLPVLLLRLITIFLNIFLIYGCYRHICSEAEEIGRKNKQNRSKREEEK